MTIFHYRETFKAVRSGLRRTPTLAENANTTLLRQVSQNFRKEFPNAEIGRHAVGHRGEFSATLDEAKRHGVAKKGGGIFIMPQMKGKEFVATARGMEFRQDISITSARKLIEITRVVYSAFPILEGKLPKI